VSGPEKKNGTRNKLAIKQHIPVSDVT